jgi:hypothetical protein
MRLTASFLERSGAPAADAEGSPTSMSSQFDSARFASHLIFKYNGTNSFPYQTQKLVREWIN